MQFLRWLWYSALSRFDSDPYAGFTDKPRAIMDLAAKHASRLNHPRVGTEHVLLALADDQYSIAANALAQAKGGIVTMRNAIERFLEKNPIHETSSESASWLIAWPRTEYHTAHQVTPQVIRIFWRSRRVARKMKSNYVSSEHLLLALLADSSAAGYQVLAGIGVTPSALRKELASIVRE